MRGFKIKDIHLFILRRVGEGSSVTQIAKITKLSKTSISRHIKRLVNNGYVYQIAIGKSRKKYLLTNRGFNEISKGLQLTNAPAKGLQNISSDNENNIKKLLKNNSIQRKHYFSVMIPVNNAPRWWQINHENKTRMLLEKKEIPYKTKELNGWRQYTFIWNSTRIKTTPKSIIFITPETYENDIGESLKESWKYLEDAILYAERLLNIRLNREERTIRIVTNEHTAFMNCPIAKFLAEMGHKRFTIYNPDNKKIEYAWDESIKDFKESEFFGADQDTHIENFKNEFGAIYRGESSPIENKKDIAKLTDIANNLVNSMGMVTDTQKEISNKFAYEMGRHMELLNELQIVVAELKKSVQLRDKLLEKLLRRLEDV